MELVLQNYVFPLLNSNLGYLRARVRGNTSGMDVYVDKNCTEGWTTDR